MSSQKHSSHCGADQLACIASYFSSTPHCRQKRPHGRLPLAWVAASPSARLVAEQRNAWMVLPYKTAALSGSPFAQDAYEDNAFGATLANATAPLFILRDALGLHAADSDSNSDSNGGEESGDAVTTASNGTSTLSSSLLAKITSWISQTVENLADVNHAASSVETQQPAFFATSRAKPAVSKSTRPSTGVHGPRVEDPLGAARGCGVHLGGLTTVLVSGVHLYEKSLLENLSASQPPQDPAGKRPNDALQKDNKANGIRPSSVLFPSTTCCGGSVSSLLSVPPNAAVYDAIPACDVKQKSLEGPQVKTACLFQEGVELHEDGGAEDETAHDPQTATSVYTVQQVNKLHEQVREGHVADAYTTLWYRHVFLDAEEVTANVLCGVTQWWLQRSVHLHELPTTKVSKLQLHHHHHPLAPPLPSLLKAPLLYVKFTADIGADLWWLHHLLSIVRRRFAQHRWHTAPLLRWVVLLWLFIAVLVESIMHGSLDAPARQSTSTQGGRGDDAASDLVASFYRMGEVYGGSDHLAALDVSHTSVRGVHLLACALGKVLGMRADASEDAQGAPRSRNEDHFTALDAAGCIQLHHRQGEMNLLATQLKALHEDSAKKTQEISSLRKVFSPLPLVNLLMKLSLCDEKTRATRSATGLALALLSHHGSLTWVSGAGCSLDNAALHELGTYALLVETVTSSNPLLNGSNSADIRSSSCSICAMDLTSALSLDDLNPTAYLPHLEQLLVPFTYVTDDGVARLEGHTYPQDLCAYFSLCKETISMLEGPVQAVVKTAMKSLEPFIAAASPDSTASALNTERQACTNGGKEHNHAVEALHQRFRSHLYQIDFTYCSCLSNVNGLCRQQRLELLNVSQTRVSKAGLFAQAGKSSSFSVSSDTPCPPLRLFIAEMCERLDDLSGLAHISTLECLIVRSGSLGDDGVRAVCTKNMRHLQLVDLSYCDRLHHVGCLAQLPALETLILDSTDVTPAEVRHLNQCRTLKTLSVRFCSEFAFIGKNKAELELVVGKFPSLKNYFYENLIGDEELRKKKS